VNPLFVWLPALNLVALGFIYRWGTRSDLTAGGVFVAGMALAMGLSLMAVPGLLVWCFLIDVGLFLTIWLLAERARRWWMVAMAGFQLIALLTYLAPWFAWERLHWAFVTFHWVIGIMDSLCLIAAVFEVRWARQWGA